MTPARTIKNHLLALLVSFSCIAASAQVKSTLHFYTVKDSTYTLWSSIPKSTCDPSWENYMVDAAGDLFKLSTRYPDINHPMKLGPEGWVTWDKGIGPESITSLETDGRGLIFASSREHFYLLQDSVWKELPTSKYGYPPIAFPDGGLYRFCDEKGGENTYMAERKQIMRWSENGYQPCGTNGRPLFLKHRTDRFMVDRKGQIYSYEDHEYGKPNGPVEIYLYKDGSWQTIGTLPADIIFRGFDMNNNLYVNGWDDEHNHYFKKWDGQAWSDVLLPQGIELGSGILFDEVLNIYIEGNDEANHQAVLFRHTGSEWKEVARSDSYQQIDKFIPTSGDIYAVMWKDKTVRRFASKWIVRQMEIADIPVDPEAKASPHFTSFDQKDLDKIKLFREDNKLGVQDMDGNIRVHAVFDMISLVITPPHMLALGENEELNGSRTWFCLQMIQGHDTVFAAITPLVYGSPFPFQIKAFRKRVARTCKTCGGKGEVPDREVTVTVRGEWVPGKTTYSTSGENIWYPSCNCYVYTTTTITQSNSGGYYEKDKQETKTIPGGICEDCEGKGKFYVFERYEYSREKGGYIRVWE